MEGRHGWSNGLKIVLTIVGCRLAAAVACAIWPTSAIVWVYLTHSIFCRFIWGFPLKFVHLGLTHCCCVGMFPLRFVHEVDSRKMQFGVPQSLYCLSCVCWKSIKKVFFSFGSKSNQPQRFRVGAFFGSKPRKCPMISFLYYTCVLEHFYQIMSYKKKLIGHLISRMS